jgi:perosamine synthetase
MVGFKYKISNVQAAIGCAQVERIEELITRKREIMATYRSAFAHLPEIALNPENEGTVNGAWMPTAVFADSTGIDRAKLVDAFASQNIDARVFFHPLSSLPMFESKPANRIAWSIPERAINLPSYHEINSEDLVRVTAVVYDLIGTIANRLV